MNLTELERRLILAARLDTPGEQVPYAFEKRVLAHIQSRSACDHARLWARALWRATAPCAGIMLLLIGWTVYEPLQAASTTPDLPQHLDHVVLAIADQEASPDSAW